MRNTIIISTARDCYIEILNDTADLGTWTVQSFKKRIGIKDQISSDKFKNRLLALTFANTMKREHSRRLDSTDTVDR
jgi:hypothetical protein